MKPAYNQLSPEKLRIYAYRTGLTQVDIAKRTGYSRAYINAIFNGRRVKSEIAEMVAEALGTTIDSVM